MCPKLQMKRGLKSDGTLTVEMRGDMWLTIKPQHTEPIDDSNVL